MIDLFFMLNNSISNTGDKYLGKVLYQMCSWVCPDINKSRETLVKS